MKISFSSCPYAAMGSSVYRRRSKSPATRFNLHRERKTLLFLEGTSLPLFLNKGAVIMTDALMASLLQ
jgi:hypothetical protein